MRQFLKSRFFVVVTVIALILVAVPTVLSTFGLTDPLRGAVNILMTPLQKGFNYITDALDGYTAYFTEFDELVAENTRLKAQLADLSDRIYTAQETETRNQWLSQFLEMKRAHTDFTFADAAITGHESVNYMTVFTVDKGTSHGIRAGMPVVTPDGVLGFVDEVGLTWAKIRTLIEASTAVGACVERTGEDGLIEGSFALSRDGFCRLTYLDAESDVQVGDRIVTSGYGSVYPRGLVIGYVTEIVPDLYSRTLTATVQPAASLTDLERVMIITSYETFTES
ncbi:MAG: rod shape-determining protein MreC [Clostridia bacterium]|nr:rod shape-determining protein MreC [Clostridia bacterium]